MRCHKNFVHPQLFMQIGSPLATLNCSMIFLHLKQPRKKCSKMKIKKKFFGFHNIFLQGLLQCFFLFTFLNGKWLRDLRDCWFYPLMQAGNRATNWTYLSSEHYARTKYSILGLLYQKRKTKKIIFLYSFFFYY